MVKIIVLSFIGKIEVKFRVTDTTPMSKLKKIYARQENVSVGSLRFLFDCRRIGDEETPASLEMENDDVIEVYTEQIGG